MMDHQISNNTTPLVTIIITSYNRAYFIESTIESALAQDYANLEILISDDYSTDNTDIVIGKYISDKRIKYFRNENNIGMTANFKLATERANGKFISYLSCDDYLINNYYISESISLINKYDNVLLVMSMNKTLNMGTQKIVTGGGFNKEFYKGKELFLQFPHIKTFSWAGALMHRETLLSLHPFEKRFTSIDVMCNLKFMLLGNMAFLNKPSYMLRIHDDNATNSINIQQAIDNFDYITEPYNAALKSNTIPKKDLDKWKIDSAFLYARAASVRFAPRGKRDYNTFIKYVKEHFPGVYQKLRLNFKWNILIFFFKRPSFSLKFFKLVSKGHLIYLQKLIGNDKENVVEKVKL